MENVVILGTGIAGCTAALYTARANLRPLVIGGPEEGGQLTLTTTVENFPGFPEGVQGSELVASSKKQAERFGARFQPGQVERLHLVPEGFALTVGTKELLTQAVIITTGASARWLGLPSEEKYKGRGVTTCATCDGALFKGKEVVVIGGGDSAMEEALFLTKFATQVTIIHRRELLRASPIMQDRVDRNEKIQFLLSQTVQEVLGDGKKVTGVRLQHIRTKKLMDFPCQGVFLAIGHVPNTGFLKGVANLDEQGYVIVDDRLRTSQPGIFAAGDVQDKLYRQAITAAGTGCQAAMEVEKYLAAKE